MVGLQNRLKIETGRASQSVCAVRVAAESPVEPNVTLSCRTLVSRLSSSLAELATPKSFLLRKPPQR